MTSSNGFLQEFHELGRVWLRGALTPGEVETLRRFSATPGQPGGRFDPGSPLFQRVGKALFLNQINEIQAGALPVRIVSFAKTETESWQLPWHQDRVIAVQEKHEIEGFSRWGRKAGIWHCEPPEEVLRGMLFVRAHLDESTAQNGAMEIALGSHRHGKLPRAAIAQSVAASEIEVTTAQPGDVLVMSMFILHRSKVAVLPQSRRVLRIDYASEHLPKPLEWAG